MVSLLALRYLCLGTMSTPGFKMGRRKGCGRGGRSGMSGFCKIGAGERGPGSWERLKLLVIDMRSDAEVKLVIVGVPDVRKSQRLFR